MAKIYLTREEKLILQNEGSIVLQRNCYVPCPNSSIIHGIGNKYIWDKIERIWVYGDVDAYIEKNKNVGRRATDYKDNTRNTWSGSNWWEFLGCENDEFGNIGKIVKNGIKNIIHFKIDNISVADLPLRNPDNPNSTRNILLDITISKL